MKKASWHEFQVLTKRLATLGPRLSWPESVWMGVSIENDRWTLRADLQQVQAPVRFISTEPLLGPLTSLRLEGIDWVIAGGESGPGHRAPKIEWFQQLRDQCVEARVPFF